MYKLGGFWFFRDQFEAYGHDGVADIATFASLV